MDNLKEHAGSNGKKITLYIDGELSVYSITNEVIQVVNDHIKQGFTNFTLNMSDVPLVTSKGLEVLQECHALVKNIPGEIKIIYANESVTKTLQVAKMHRKFGLKITRQKQSKEKEEDE